MPTPFFYTFAVIFNNSNLLPNKILDSRFAPCATGSNCINYLFLSYRFVKDGQNPDQSPYDNLPDAAATCAYRPYTDCRLTTSNSRGTCGREILPKIASSFARNLRVLTAKRLLPILRAASQFLGEIFSRFRSQNSLSQKTIPLTTQATAR